MSTLGLSMMVVTWIIVTTIVTYFFVKVLRTPQEKNEE